MNIELLAACVVGILSSARLTRLIVDDSWPVTEWIKFRYLMVVNEAWAELVRCAFCFAPWATLVVGAWGWASGLHWTWWAFNGWLAGAYLAALVVVRDTPE